MKNLHKKVYEDAIIALGCPAGRAVVARDRVSVLRVEAYVLNGARTQGMGGMVTRRTPPWRGLLRGGDVSSEPRGPWGVNRTLRGETLADSTLERPGKVYATTTWR